MRSLVLILGLAMTFSGLSATAKSLDEARAIAKKIERITRFPVMRSDADDSLFGPEAGDKLSEILGAVLSRRNLAVMSPKDIGNFIIDHLAVPYPDDDGNYGTTYNIREKNHNGATEMFCQLASDTCRIFTADISSSLCPAGKPYPAEMIKNIGY